MKNVNNTSTRKTFKRQGLVVIRWQGQLYSFDRFARRLGQDVNGDSFKEDMTVAVTPFRNPSHRLTVGHLDTGMYEIWTRVTFMKGDVIYE